MIYCLIRRCDLELVERCAVNAQDLGGLLLLHSSTGNREGMLSLAEDAKKAGRTNVAFLALFVCGKVLYTRDVLVYLCVIGWVSVTCYLVLLCVRYLLYVI